MPPDIHTLESMARVVRIEGAVAWLEPEQTTSCGNCASAAACGTGLGTVANRMEARRFALDNPGDLCVGERIVIGINDGALMKASLTAYALPLATALTAGSLAEWMLGNDLASMAAMVAGLGFGLLAAHLAAGRLSTRGELAPHYLRRAQPGETCGTHHQENNRRKT